MTEQNQDKASAVPPRELTALQARAAIGQHQLSASTLLESCIEQVERLDPVVNALVIPNFAEAREAAKEADALQAQGGCLASRPLHGLPVAIKDIQSIKGLPTTWGDSKLQHDRATTDSPIVARIRRAGGVLLGKTNVPEKSIGANTVNSLFGATGNPYAPQRTCGGSSGGSGVALATRMAPLATGSDHGGSLRIPACYSGVVGVRATPGMVPNEQRGMPQTNYAVQGPMARTVSDAALLLSVIAERDAASRQDPMVFPFDASCFARLDAAALGGIKVGVTPDLGGVLVSQTVRETFAQRCLAIEGLVGRLSPCDVDLTQAPMVDWHLRQELFAAAYAQEAEHWNDDVNPNVRATYESAIATPMQDIARAKQSQLALTRHMAAMFSEFDVVIAPGVSIPPFVWNSLNPQFIDGKPVQNYMAWLELTAALTVVGHPVVSLPCGLDAQGTPFGIQVIGPMYEDHRLLSVAVALEAAFAEHPLLHTPPPDFDWLARQDAGCKTLGRAVQSTHRT